MYYPYRHALAREDWLVMTGRVVCDASHRDSLDHFGDAGAAHGAMGELAGAITAAAVMSAGDERARHFVIEANL